MTKISFTFDWGEKNTKGYTTLERYLSYLFCPEISVITLQSSTYLGLHSDQVCHTCSLLQSLPYFKRQYNIHGLFICCCTTYRSWERNSFIISFCNSSSMTSSSLSLNLLLLSSSWYVAFLDRVTFPLKNFTVNKKFSKSEHGSYFSLHKSHKKISDATRIGELGFNRITLKLLVSFKI